jgi:hypothetical protein
VAVIPPIDDITDVNAPDSKNTKHINKILVCPTPDINTSKFLLNARGFHIKDNKIAGRIATVGESVNFPPLHEVTPNVTNIAKNNNNGNKLKNGACDFNQ